MQSNIGTHKIIAMKKITIVLAMLIGFAAIAQEHDGQKEHFRKGPAGL